MQAVLSDQQSAKFSSEIKDLFLGVNESDGRVVVNVYLNRQVIEEQLRKLIVSFTFQGEEIAFEVCELKQGTPMRLILKPISSHKTVREFLLNVVSACMVPTVTILEDGKTCTIENMRFNPDCLH